jgi:hypothetical protein
MTQALPQVEDKRKSKRKSGKASASAKEQQL